MHLYLTDTEILTLRDVFRTAGLRDRQIEDIMLLLSFKRERVQKAFYYRAQGLTYEQVGERVDVPMRGAHAMITEQCWDVQEYLKKT